MKLGLVSKSDLKKFHEWLTDKIGELSHMELEDIALEAFMAGMREGGLTQRAADGGQPLPLFCPVHHISYQAVDGCPECDRRR